LDYLAVLFYFGIHQICAIFVANLDKTFRDDSWHNMVPGLLVLVLHFTYQLTNSIATRKTLATHKVNSNFVIFMLKIFSPISRPLLVLEKIMEKRPRG
jgi:uncharacterized membrane protein